MRGREEKEERKDSRDEGKEGLAKKGKDNS